MYQIENIKTALRGLRPKRGVRPAVSRNVFLIGLTSLFTDISAEMVATILPLYLVVGLGLSPLQFGVIDGLYQGAAAFVRLGGGIAADRWRRYKEIAFIGYAMSALVKPLFLVVGAAWTGIAGLILADRVGKGIRTAPRDAMISLSSSQKQLGASFGVHRALDTVGAFLGPLIAFALLVLLPGQFDSVFVISFSFALIGLGILGFFVRAPAGTARQPSFTWKSLWRALAAKRFRLLLLMTVALSLATISDGFFYLILQNRLGFDATLLPLLYVGTALSYLLLAVPVGRLADRVGRGRVFLGGYVVLLIAYGLLLLVPGGTLALLLFLLLFGAYYAATDGVLMALGSASLPPAVRGSGLAVLATGTSFGRLLASVLFGLAWTAFGTGAAVSLFAASLLLVLLTAMILSRRTGLTHA